MKGKYSEKTIKISRIQLDQKNPRFPPVNNQREAITVMLREQGTKIVSLATDIYQRGLNPSSKLILFKDGNKYIDGDGNRRLTALKILETPSLSDSEPRIRKKIDAILKSKGTIPSEVSCVVFESRDDAKHWISINHSGLQEGKGQIPWDSEQKNRFEGKFTIGLQALDLLAHNGRISLEDKSRISKTTLDRLLGFQAVKEMLAIKKNGDHFSFGDNDKLTKVVIALKDSKVDVVYTAEKGASFVDRVLRGDYSPLTDGAHKSSYAESNPKGTPGDVQSSSTESNRHYSQSGQKENEKENSGSNGSQSSTRSRRTSREPLTVFGGPLSLRTGHINNLYRDIEQLYTLHKSKSPAFSDDFIVIFRMSLRMLAETAAREAKMDLQKYLSDNFDSAKKTLDQDMKTSLSSQSVEKGKVVQLFQTGAHDYANSRNEEQALALSVILGAILKITHGKRK